MDSGGVCTKTVTQYQLVMTITVGHYRVNNKGDEESIYHHPVTFLLVNSSVLLSRGLVWEFATWYYFIFLFREI